MLTCEHAAFFRRRNQFDDRCLDASPSIAWRKCSSIPILAKLFSGPGLVRHRAAVDSGLKLSPGISAGRLSDTVHKISPMTHLVEQADAGQKDSTPKRGSADITLRVCFEFSDDVIVDFDMSRVAGAPVSLRYAALAVTQIGDIYERLSILHQRASHLCQSHRTKTTKVRSDNRM
jgi:hypothetical protein